MESLIKFYREINKIKNIKRNGWERIGIVNAKDTIASHSFGATLISWVLSKRANLNENKLIKLLLIHDLIMAHVNDTTPADKEHSSKRENENIAFEKLSENIPPEIKEEFRLLFHEYQKEETEEAILARECDKLDTLLQSLMYSEELGKNKLSEFISSYENKFKSKTGKKIFEDLKKIKIN
ncbi:HD domain-containing protein [Candidatus Pacearchaeota archaeon]|nr:HD domain-containing protein [Candidatus Pacearchaeota archaeon]